MHIFASLAGPKIAWKGTYAHNPHLLRRSLAFHWKPMAAKKGNEGRQERCEQKHRNGHGSLTCCVEVRKKSACTS